MTDPGIAVTKIGMTQRLRRVQIEQVEEVAVVGRPEIPNPVIGQRKDQTALLAKRI